MRVYRIASIRFDPNSSEGARIYGGRWNEPGTPVIYSFANPSLAALEVLVHFQMIPADYRIITISLPDDLEISTVEIASLPDDWHEETSLPRTAAMGTSWAKSRSTVALRVPSAALRSEHNYILNPLHPRFPDIVFEVSTVDEIDRRLRRTK